MSTPRDVSVRTNLLSIGSQGVGVFGALALRFGMQGAYFLLLARYLHAAAYGQFVGAVAFIGFFGPLSSLGAGHALIRASARTPGSAGQYAKHALRVAATGSATTTVALVGAVLLFASDSIIGGVGLVLVCSDLLLAPVSEVASQYLQGTGEPRRAATLQLLPGALRLLTLATVPTLLGDLTLSSWLLLYGIAGCIGHLSVVAVVAIELRAGATGARRPVDNISDTGIPIATMSTSQMLTNDADKVVLAALRPSADVGGYSAAYRIVDVALTPLRAVMYTAYPHFFAGPDDSLVHARRLGLRIAFIAFSFSLPLAVLLWLVAPMAPMLIGPSFEATSDALRILVLLVPLRALQQPAADALLGSGRAWERLCVVIIAAVLNVSLLVFLVPSQGWLAAAWISIATDSLLAAGYWTLLLTRPSWRRSRARV